MAFDQHLQYLTPRVIIPHEHRLGRLIFTFAPVVATRTVITAAWNAQRSTYADEREKARRTLVKLELVERRTPEIPPSRVVDRSREALSARHAVVLINGVTGHESFYIEGDVLERLSQHGWTACAGCVNRWDRLHINAEQMRAFADAVKRYT